MSRPRAPFKVGDWVEYLERTDRGAARMIRGRVVDVTRRERFDHLNADWFVIISVPKHPRARRNRSMRARVCENIGTFASMLTPVSLVDQIGQIGREP